MDVSLLSSYSCFLQALMEAFDASPSSSIAQSKQPKRIIFSPLILQDSFGVTERIQNKKITIDGKVTTLPDTKLRAGAELVYHRLPWREPDAPYLLQVLFEDDYLVNEISECNTMRKICKIYWALVSGVMDMDEVFIKQPIGRIKYPGVAKGLYVASPSGKPALSSVRVLERDLENNCTLVQVEIQSGRPHQIRIHLSFIGLPLIGESFEEDGGHQIPGNPVLGDSGYNLHAHQLFLSTRSQMSLSRLQHLFQLSYKRKKNARRTSQTPARRIFSAPACAIS
ncbi:hypothetical protein K7X08_002798 [Anisodus acutangulus]|uniref:Pseudouridine synthase RsuA/RluA-like domain-containing protein n=1 Tax=Anisodus acutangulus TaxID=402998 RepID=A0A9Q1RF48_9SOLA|nr:hypothetical protein K7X08_002798 [Anisodus acutangulus]